jgi:hypothetical protein
MKNHIGELEKELEISIKRLTNIVCGMDELISSVAFNVYCLKSGLFDKWNIDNIEVISLDRLECILLDYGFDEYFGEMLLKWDNKSGPLDEPAYSRLYQKRDRKPPNELNWKHLSEAEKEITINSTPRK